ATSIKGRSLTRLPNGSRLSCGASAGGRKRPTLRYELVGAQTYAPFESRPRQLQALVRQRLKGTESCGVALELGAKACSGRYRHCAAPPPPPASLSSALGEVRYSESPLSTVPSCCHGLT